MRPHAFRAALCCLVLACCLAGPVSGASASAGSIKQALKSYNSRVLVSEGHVVSALGTFEENHVAAPVVAAINESVVVLKSLRAKIERQSAAATRVKEAKTLIIKGIGSVIAAYTRLDSAFSETTVNPEAAKVEVEKSDTDIRRAHAELKKGSKLLG